ncbi:hypothetical protein LV469_00745 [Peptoniphilus sp. GNH]|nr:hypothetical protein HMPREF3189_01342 [Clostridiales bacterium KA00134]UHR02846.1 hypothetical protein LV469_00745 [Peptoniphilus sp. GNH]
MNRLFDRYADKEYVDKNQEKIKYFIDLYKTDWFYYEMVEAANTHEYHRRHSSLEEVWHQVFKDYSKKLDK